MDDRVFEVLFKHVSAVVEELQPFTPATVDIYRMWYGSRGFFLLSPDGVTRRRDLLRCAMRWSDWGDKFSLEYLSQRLRDVIEIHALNGADEARAALRPLVAELEAYAEEHAVFLPVFGISVPDAPARTLGGIVFHQSSAEFLERIASEETFSVSYLKRHTDAEVWAEVCVVGEPTHAVRRAEEECGHSIDVLRFWMACMTKTGTPCAIGLQGDVVTTERPRLVFSKTGDAKRFDPHRSRRIPGFPLSQEVLDKLHAARLDAIAAVLDTPPGKRSAFDKLLLHAVHIFCSSPVQAAVADRVLNLITFLGNFFTPREGHITPSVSER